MGEEGARGEGRAGRPPGAGRAEAPLEGPGAREGAGPGGHGGRVSREAAPLPPGGDERDLPNPAGPSRTRSHPVSPVPPGWVGCPPVGRAPPLFLPAFPCPPTDDHPVRVSGTPTPSPARPGRQLRALPARRLPQAPLTQSHPVWEESGSREAAALGLSCRLAPAWLRDLEPGASSWASVSQSVQAGPA